ncbi:hypothetical protein BX600DRAFT_457439 [Xylariales sp. PMI_506]|nr:hypothetical protein BX600DRAFT_457439 [Xylariales sp. PMI_506]
MAGTVRPCMTSKKLMLDQAEATVSTNRLPLNLGAPSLSSLSEELIIRIIELLQDVSPHSVDNLASVSSSFSQRARYIQVRHVALDLSRIASLNRLDAISKRGLLSAIRVLEVGRPGGDQLSRLAQLIPFMTALRDLHWAQPTLPEKVQKILKDRPLVRLHLVASGTYSDPAVLEDLVAALTGSSNLHTLRAEIEITSTSESLAMMQPLKRMLISCPNLRKLSLNIDHPRYGCIIYGPSNEYCGFGFANKERLAPLRELEIQAYPWGQSMEGPHTFYSVGYPKGEERELAYWADTFDWSQLQRLHESFLQVGLEIASKLEKLKHVRIDKTSRVGDKRVKKFFEEIPSILESICLPNLRCVGLPVILRHGSNLRRLELHQQELWDGTWKQDAITAKSLQQLRSDLPHLKELSIDVKRDGKEWPWETLEVLGSMSLDRLELWFELGIKSRGPVLQPVLTLSSASELFAYIRKHASRLPLSYLHVHSGCPPAIGYGLMSEEGYWPGQNSTSFECRTAERDEDAAQGRLDVSCPSLSNELNQKAWRILKGEEERCLPKTDKISFRVAMDGPMPVDEWLEWYNEEMGLILDCLYNESLEDLGA